FADQRGCFARVQWQVTAAKVLPIGMARMCASSDAERAGQAQGFAHAGFIAGMRATGNVRRTDQRNDCRIIAATLAKVAIEIDVLFVAVECAIPMEAARMCRTSIEHYLSGCRRCLAMAMSDRPCAA